MVEYGCNVANKFGFMSDDDDVEDPQELISKAAKAGAEKAAAQKKADKDAAKPAPSKDVVKSTATGKENNRPSTAERGRGGRGRGRGNGAPRTPREGADVSDRFGEGGRGRGGPRGRGNRPFRGRGGNVNTSDAPKEVSFEENNQEVNAEGGRGRRGGRGFGGDRGNFGDAVGRGGRGGRGRQFERHSGSDRTGVRGQEKKDGHGKGNWGTEKDEIVAETENVEKEEATEPEQPREKTEEEIAYEAELEHFNKLKTLKEFKAAQQRSAPSFKTRQAGEGTEENFGKLVPLKKDIVEEKEDEVIIVRKESNKKLLDINIQFAETGHRGSRGAPRGRNSGPRGGRGRGGHGRQSAPFDASLEAFPALGAK